jgi:2-polyprenyl-3-methyl-5-hydroxy-6-metoxy-1,4-benzoquinol methylase
VFSKDINYTGIDLNSNYIEENKKKFPYAKFYVSKADAININEKFDIILCNAVMHHLSDEEIRQLLSNIKNMLSVHGKVIIQDPVRVENQHFFAKLLMDYDRGQNIKFEADFKKITEEFFPIVKTSHTNFSWFPYNHLITEARLN